MKKWIYIALVFGLFSCERQLDINLPELEQKLVVNAFGNSTDSLQIYLANNTNILGEPALRNVDGPVRLLLSEDGQLILDKSYLLDSGLLQTHVKLKAGKRYDLVLDGQDFPVVNAFDAVPEELPDFQILDLQEFGEQVQLDLLMLDKAGSQWYMIEVYLNSFEVVGADTLWYQRGLNFTSSDKIFVSNINTILAQTHFALFDDRLMHGSDRMIQMLIEKGELESRAAYEVSHISVKLKSLSPTYFDYYIDLLENNHVYGGPLASSTYKSGNVTGGLGIFGCYTYRTDTISIP